MAALGGKFGRIGRRFGKQINKGLLAVGGFHKLGDRHARASYSHAGFLSPEDIARESATKARFGLTWIAGERGRPGLNAAITPASGDDGNDGATKAELDLMNATDRYFEILGNNASNDDVTHYAEGGLKFETDGGGTDAVVLLPHLNADQSPWTSYTWGTDREVRWGCRIRTGSAITAQVIHAGLKLTNVSTVATDADQVYFYFAPATNGGRWVIYSENTGVLETFDTGVAVAVDTDYELAIEIDASRVPRFYINEVSVSPQGNASALKAATDLIPYIGLLESAAAAKHMYVRSQSISRLLNAS